MTPIERRSTVTRLGRGVDLSGRLAAEAIEAACAAVDPYVATLQELGAEAGRRDRHQRRPRRRRTAAPSSPSCASASPSRPACSTARKRRGSPTWARPPSTRPRCRPLVIDIGGGSTELIVGEGRDDRVARLAAGRASSATPSATSSPTRPRAVELEALAADLRGLIETRHASRRRRAEAGIAVAGTPTSLAAIEMELEPYDPKRVHGHVLELPVDPADAVAARLRPARRAHRRSAACTPTARRRSSPGS